MTKPHKMDEGLAEEVPVGEQLEWWENNPTVIPADHPSNRTGKEERIFNSEIELAADEPVIPEHAQTESFPLNVELHDHNKAKAERKAEKKSKK